MILTAHIIEIGLLVAVLAALLRRDRPAETNAPIVARSAEAAPRLHWATMLCGVDGWKPDGKFVREGTPAWQAAHDESGRALRSPDGVLMEGTQ